MQREFENCIEITGLLIHYKVPLRYLRFSSFWVVDTFSTRPSKQNKRPHKHNLNWGGGTMPNSGLLLPMKNKTNSSDEAVTIGHVPLLVC